MSNNDLKNRVSALENYVRDLQQRVSYLETKPSQKEIRTVYDNRTIPYPKCDKRTIKFEDFPYNPYM